jgi:predicted permease
VSPQLRRRIVPLGLVAGGVVAFLALVVSSNVGHLLLLHACHRSRELAIREALGADPGRILRQLCFESALIAAAGFAGALAVASAVLRAMKGYALPFGLPRSADVVLDSRILLLTLAVSVATNLAFGASAALAASRLDWRRALHAGRSPLPSLAPRLGRKLLGGQVALALVLLIGGAVFHRTVVDSLERHPGFAAEGVQLLSVSLNGLPGRYDEARGLRYFADALSRVRALPTVKDAAWSAAPPFEVLRLLAWWRQAPQDPWIQSDVDIVGPGYFRLMGTRITQGREFLASDGVTEPGVAIVNEAMARKHWPGRAAIGQRLLVRGRAREVYEVVGVAEDVRRRSPWDEAEPFFYLPLQQRYFASLTLHLKGDARGAAEVLRGLDPELPAFDQRRMEDTLASAVADQRFAALLLGICGAIGALIAVLGLYASTAYVVAQRVHELAIRSVLGATRGQVIQHIVTDCGAPVALGVAAGLGMAAWLSRFVAGLVHGVSPLDPASFALSSVTLAATCFVAVYLPASRAIREDPAEVLRAD